MSRMNSELFQFIERRGSVTVDDVVEKLGISRRSAATILSRFTNYEKDGIIKHYLIYEKSNISRQREFTRVELKDRKSRYGPKHKVRAPGSYKIGPDWWGELKGAMSALIT